MTSPGLLPSVSLQPHQHDAVRRIVTHGSQILHHGTGTGKTFTLIAGAEALRHHKGAKGNVLVVVPAALKANFVRNGLDKVLPKGSRGRYHVHSYEYFRRHHKRLIDTIKPDVLLADEIHRAKDPEGRTYAALESASKHVKHRILATASLISNHPSDVVPLVHISAGHPVFKSREEFNKNYIHSKKVHPGLIGRLLGVKPGVVEKLKRAGHLSGVMAQHIHRFDGSPESRKHFPTVHQRDINVPMSKAQKKVYDYSMDKLGPVSRWMVEHNLPPGKGQARSFLGKLQHARQVANSPHVLDTRIKPEEAAEHSPKLHHAVESAVKHLKAHPKHRVMLYTNLVHSGTNPLFHALKRRGIRAGVFAGHIDKDERNKAISHYNKGKHRALIVSPAGAEGLDLKGTTKIVMVDPHWNPEKIRQAIGRGARYKSHQHLPPHKRRVEVEHLHSTAPFSIFRPFHRPTLIDRYVSSRAREKAHLNQRFIDLVKHSSADIDAVIKSGAFDPRGVMNVHPMGGISTPNMPAGPGGKMTGQADVMRNVTVRPKTETGAFDPKKSPSMFGTNTFVGGMDPEMARGSMLTRGIRPRTPSQSPEQFHSSQLPVFHGLQQALGTVGVTPLPNLIAEHGARMPNARWVHAHMEAAGVPLTMDVLHNPAKAPEHVRELLNRHRPAITREISGVVSVFRDQHDAEMRDQAAKGQPKPKPKSSSSKKQARDMSRPPERDMEGDGAGLTEVTITTQHGARKPVVGFESDTERWLFMSRVTSHPHVAKVEKYRGPGASDTARTGAIVSLAPSVNVRTDSDLLEILRNLAHRVARVGMVARSVTREPGAKIAGDAPRPRPDEVAYAHPNLDGSRKNCSNCMMWSRDKKCAIFKQSQTIKATMVCNYHVYGAPMEKWEAHDKLDPVDPKLAGLIDVPGGTSCDNCFAYAGDAKKGKCAVVAVDGKDAPVEAKGCCNRWEKKSHKTAAMVLNSGEKKLRIGLDYDNTYSADPKLWERFIGVAKQRGHKVTIVTARTPDDHVRKAVKADIPIVFTSLKAKRPVAAEAGHKIDVWIDDRPQGVDNDHPSSLIGNGDTVNDPEWRRQFFEFGKKNHAMLQRFMASARGKSRMAKIRERRGDAGVDLVGATMSVPEGGARRLSDIRIHRKSEKTAQGPLPPGRIPSLKGFKLPTTGKVHEALTQHVTGQVPTGSEKDWAKTLAKHLGIGDSEPPKTAATPEQNLAALQSRRAFLGSGARLGFAGLAASTVPPIAKHVIDTHFENKRVEQQQQDSEFARKMRERTKAQAKTGAPIEKTYPPERILGLTYRPDVRRVFEGPGFGRIQCGHIPGTSNPADGGAVDVFSFTIGRKGKITKVLALSRKNNGNDKYLVEIDNIPAPKDWKRRWLANARYAAKLDAGKVKGREEMHHEDNYATGETFLVEGTRITRRMQGVKRAEVTASGALASIFAPLLKKEKKEKEPEKRDLYEEERKWSVSDTPYGKITHAADRQSSPFFDHVPASTKAALRKAAMRGVLLGQISDNASVVDEEFLRLCHGLTGKISLAQMDNSELLAVARSVTNEQVGL